MNSAMALRRPEDEDNEDLARWGSPSCLEVELICALQSGVMLDSLDAAKVTGKIVVCCVRGGVRRMEKGEAVRRAGGVGMVLVNDEEGGSNVIADAHVLPALHINYTDGLALMAYIKSTP